MINAGGAQVTGGLQVVSGNVLLSSGSVSVTSSAVTGTLDVSTTNALFAGNLITLRNAASGGNGISLYQGTTALFQV